MIVRGGFEKTTIFCVLLVLTSCATGPRTQIYWINPSVRPELQQARFTTDSTECSALAYQMIPEPAPRPQPQSGDITLLTPSGPIFGSYQTQPPPPQGYQPSGFLAGYQLAEREDNRKKYAVSCMLNRGWQPQQRVIGQ